MNKRPTFFLAGIFLSFLMSLPVSLCAQNDNRVQTGGLLNAVSSNQKMTKHPDRIKKFGAYTPTSNSLQKPPATLPSPRNGNKGTVQPGVRPILKIKGGPQLWGVVEYSSAWKNMSDNDKPSGVYSFLASTPGTMKELLQTGVNGPNGGGVFYNNSFHFVNYSVMYETSIITYTYNYDIKTWQQPVYAQYGSDATVIANDLTYDASTGNVYGYFYNPLDNKEAMRFGTITYGEYGATVNTIAKEDSVFICVTADNAGQLYGISWGGGLWKIDKSTGAKQLIDYTGVWPSSFRQSATYDPKTKKIYWTAFRNDYSSGLYQVDPSTGITSLVSDIPDSMEISCLYIPEAEAADDAPAAIGDFSSSFVGASTTGTASFTAPSTSYGGDDLKGSLEYRIVANGDTIKIGTAKVGEKVKTDISTKGGKTELSVLTKNSAGLSPVSNKVSLWTGYDIPVAPTNVTLSIDKNTGKANLSWTSPVAGLNNAFFDASKLTYDVVRVPGNDTIAKRITSTAFTETLPKKQLTAYHYNVIAYNGNMASDAASSNKVTFGDAFEVPYTDNFESDDSYSLYTVVNVNKDDKTWLESNHCFCYFYSWKNSADDWLLMPPIKLSTGVTYKFAFDIKGSSTYDAEKYAAGYGRDTDVTKFVELIPSQELKTSDYITVEKTFQVSENGEYRLGIHALSDANKGFLSVTNIKVTNEAKSSVPDSVSNLKIVPADKGVLSATISFTTPTKDLEAKSLNNLSKVEICNNGGNIIKTFDNPAVGSDLKFVDDKAVNGFNKYIVTCYNGSGKGKSVADSAYVGKDIPFVPQNIKLKSNDKGAILTWDAPSTVGKHGGYVDTSSLTYSIYDSKDTLLVKGVTGNSWIYEADLDSKTSLLYFGVSANSAVGGSAIGTSSYLVTGRPSPMPYHESFAGGSSTNSLWWTVGSNMMNAFSISPEISSDHDMGSAYWFGIEPGDYAYFNSGRITASGNDAPALFFDYYATPGKDMKLSVEVEHASGETETIKTYDFKSMTGAEGWKKAAVFFNDTVKKERFFVLKFRAESNVNGVNMYIDNITMRNVLKYDLTTSIQAPTRVTAGDSIHARVKVMNNGSEQAENFNINLYADNEVVSTKNVGSLAFNNDSTFILTYAPSLVSSDSVKLYAVADYAKEAYPADNTSEKLDVCVNKPAYPVISDLTANATAGSVNLKWTAPADMKNVIQENFDSYDPWLIDNIGKWSVFDGDGIETNSYTAMYYPHIGEKFAYIVFNKPFAIMDSSQKSIFTPHSGDQCMAAFANVHDYTKSVHADDWLITPQLSGNAQKISFYVKSLTDYKEDFYVYYSTDKADTASLRMHQVNFEKFGAESSWKKFEYELPAGAKYFGLRYTSNLSGILVDDFTYEGLPLSIIGYNIYRDGKFISFVNSKSATYQDSNVNGNDHYYNVTVVYNVGESAFSNIAKIGLGIYSPDATITPFDVYTVSGVRIRHQVTDLKGLDRGVYIVNNHKVFVK